MSKIVSSIADIGQEYLPNVTPKRASDWMRGMINKTPGLKDALDAVGYTPRSVTPKMRAIICEYLGEP